MAGLLSAGIKCFKVLVGQETALEAAADVMLEFSDITVDPSVVYRANQDAEEAGLVGFPVLRADATYDDLFDFQGLILDYYAIELQKSLEAIKKIIERKNGSKWRNDLSIQQQRMEGLVGSMARCSRIVTELKDGPSRSENLPITAGRYADISKTVLPPIGRPSGRAIRGGASVSQLVAVKTQASGDKCPQKKKSKNRRKKKGPSMLEDLTALQKAEIEVADAIRRRETAKLVAEFKLQNLEAKQPERRAPSAGGQHHLEPLGVPPRP